MNAFYVRAILNGRPIDEPVEGLKWAVRREYHFRAGVVMKYLNAKGFAGWRKDAVIFGTEGQAANALPRNKRTERGEEIWRVVPIEVFN
jgi:hypothetical protein